MSNVRDIWRKIWHTIAGVLNEMCHLDRRTTCTYPEYALNRLAQHSPLLQLAVVLCDFGKLTRRVVGVNMRILYTLAIVHRVRQGRAPLQCARLTFLPCASTSWPSQTNTIMPHHVCMQGPHVGGCFVHAGVDVVPGYLRTTWSSLVRNLALEIEGSPTN